MHRLYIFAFSLMPFTTVVRGGEGEFGDTHSKAHGVGNIKNGYTSIMGTINNRQKQNSAT